jgi:hypothetical protein
VTYTLDGPGFPAPERDALWLLCVGLSACLTIKARYEVCEVTGFAARKTIGGRGRARTSGRSHDGLPLKVRIRWSAALSLG